MLWNFPIDMKQILLNYALSLFNLNSTNVSKNIQPNFLTKIKWKFLTKMQYGSFWQRLYGTCFESVKMQNLYTHHVHIHMPVFHKYHVPMMQPEFWNTVCVTAELNRQDSDRSGRGRLQNCAWLPLHRHVIWDIIHYFH